LEERHPEVFATGMGMESKANEGSDCIMGGKHEPITGLGQSYPYESCTKCGDSIQNINGEWTTISVDERQNHADMMRDKDWQRQLDLLHESKAVEYLTPEQELAWRHVQMGDHRGQKFDPLWHTHGDLGDRPDFDDAEKEYEWIKAHDSPEQNYNAVKDLELMGMVDLKPTNNYFDYSAGTSDESPDPTYYAKPTSAGLDWQNRTKGPNWNPYTGESKAVENEEEWTRGLQNTLDAGLTTSDWTNDYPYGAWESGPSEKTCVDCGDKFDDDSEYADHVQTHKMEDSQ